MIKSKVYKLKKTTDVAKNMPLQAGQEIEIVMDVVYVNGNPLPPAFQQLFYEWVMNNQDLLEDITKNW